MGTALENGPPSLAKRVTAAALRMAALPALVGALTGLVVGALTWAVDERGLGFFASQDYWWMCVWPALALPAAWAANRFITRAYSPSTTEMYIEVFHDPEKRLPVRETPGRYLAGAATVFFGGAQGLESPSTALGTTTGTLLERWFRPWFGRDNRGLLFTAGASAGIAAISSSPGAGAMFGIEAPYRRGIDTQALVPALVAAGTSYAANVWVRGPTPMVPFAGDPPVDWELGVTIVALAVVCGLAARATAMSAGQARALARRSRPWQRIVFGSLPLPVLAWIGFVMTDAWVTFGPGNIMVDWGLQEQRAVWTLCAALLLHTAGTVSCVYGGGGGGLFHSISAAGAMLGLSVAMLLGRPDSLLLPLIGMACFLGAGYRIPFAAAFLVAEGTHGPLNIGVGIAAVGIAYACMGDESIAPAQR